MAFLWLINGDDPNHLLNGMILQVVVFVITRQSEDRQGCTPGPMWDPGKWEIPIDKPYIGVSKNRGTPKWMVYNGKPY